MRFVSQIATLAAVWAATVAADADAEASEFGEMGKSLRNRSVFDRLVKRQRTECPVGTYCTGGMTCCGYFCCYVGASCNNADNDFLKSCLSDSSNSTSIYDYDSTYDAILSSMSASLSDIYASATSVQGAFGGTAPSATATPSSTDDTSTGSNAGSSSSGTSSDSFTSSNTSTTTDTKNSGFSSWSTGSKVGVIVGPIVGVAVLAGMIWWVAVMTCCKRKHKVQRVSNLNPPMAGVPQPPPGPPTVPPTPAPPYAHPNAPELGGGQDHYAYKPDAYGNYQEPPVAPKFDPQTGSYSTVNNGPVYEAPENTADSRR